MNAIDRFKSWAPHILGIARFLTGTLFACHGAQKVLGAFGGLPPGASEMLTVRIAGPIELVGGILIAVGLLTRPVAFLCSGLMACAYFMGHAVNGPWPTVNGGELAILYCWLFLYLAAHGPGAFALDNLRGRRS